MVHQVLRLTAMHLTKMQVMMLKNFWNSNDCCAAAMMQNGTEITA
jgi:hypothetical protein